MHETILPFRVDGGCDQPSRDLWQRADLTTTIHLTLFSMVVDITSVPTAPLPHAHPTMLLNLNPETVTAIGVLMPTLASIATGLRFYGRRRLRVPLKEDDWTTLVSVFLVWGLGITHIAGQFFA